MSTTRRQRSATLGVGAGRGTAGGVTQPPSAAQSIPDVHAFVAHPWGHDSCDKKLDDSGRVRTCAAPASDPVHQVAQVAAKKGKKRRG